MKTEIAKLSQISVNAANPRIIKDDKFEKLIQSILVLPKMLEIRPIVVDDTFVSLGGNMRYRALVEISNISIQDIKKKLETNRDFHKKTKVEKTELLKYWKDWLLNPTTPIVKASRLSEDEKKQFIIKDNVGFGDWDYDTLANEWDSEDLNDWGVDVWKADNANSLPDELNGVDLTPDELEKIQGDDKTLTERIIIVYQEEKKPDLEKLLGIQINKVVFDIKELIDGKE